MPKRSDFDGKNLFPEKEFPIIEIGEKVMRRHK